MRRLIIRPGAIGDTILSLPAMEHLRAEYTEVWVRSCVIPLIGFADRVRSISSTGIDLVGIEGIQPSRELLQSLGSFHEIVTWYGSNRPEFRAALGSFSRNVKFLTALPVEGDGEHAADFFLRQAGGQGTAIPRIDVGPVERRPSVVFHPFSGSDRKNWPMDRFLELEYQLGNVEWAVRPDGVVRFENLMELAKWIAGARLYVGNDSGITHLAAAAGARVIALFGPTHPDVWGPRGTRVRIVRARSMEEISTQLVRAEVAQELRLTPGA
jgi:heptosyltransferase III